MSFLQLLQLLHTLIDGCQKREFSSQAKACNECAAESCCFSSSHVICSVVIHVRDFGSIYCSYGLSSVVKIKYKKKKREAVLVQTGKGVENPDSQMKMLTWNMFLFSFIFW